jgi:hypothetical protein
LTELYNIDKCSTGTLSDSPSVNMTTISLGCNANRMWSAEDGWSVILSPLPLPAGVFVS